MGTGVDQSSEPTEGKQKLMDLRECIQDSPDFRCQLNESERDIVDLEARLEKVVTACDQMVLSGVQFTQASRTFSVSVKELAAHFKHNEVIAGTLTRFYEILKELQSYYSILFDQAQRSVQTSLRAFLSGELKKVKETKKVFHRVSDELNACAVRNGNAPRGKLQECEEASVQLANAKNMFSHHAIDYGYQINSISCVKGHEILSNLLSFMRSQFTFFHQGYDLLHEFDPFMRQVGTQVDLFRKDSQEAIKEMDSRHSLVASHHLQDGSPEAPLQALGNPTLAIENSGYLFKRPRGNSLFKHWSRRWFVLKDNKLVYQSESKDDDSSIVAEDMRMCTVKYNDDLERRFCFEIVTPWRSCMVQADSEALRKQWVAYIEASIARALRVGFSNKTIDEDEFQRRSFLVTEDPIQVLDSSPKGAEKRSSFSMAFTFLNVPGNNRCADCDGENPTWASINLGIMLCIECSGIHRSLGVHISKVRSVTLDDWESDLQKIMCQLGNARVNAIYEFDIPSHVRKPSADSSRSARETFIRLKYAQHAFVHPHPNCTRAEIPMPPTTIPDLLTPSKSPHASFHGNNSTSPTRRSFSPSFKLRSPRVPKNIPAFKPVSRPSSASSTNYVSDYSTPADSTEDLRSAGLLGPKTNSMQALAENFKKLEKSGKLKSWGSTSLSDKIRNSARRSSRRISTYAKSKLSEARDKLKTKEKNFGREVHSDEEEMGSSSTPLLYSISASTQNLSLSTPPPKPPRTFATKRLSTGSLSDEENELFREDDFSDILAAIKEMGVLATKDPLESEEVIPNGVDVLSEGQSKLKKSESSPQLSHNTKVPRQEQVASIGPSPLNTIVEDFSAREEPEVQPPEETCTDAGVLLTVDTCTDGPNERLSNSAPLRRKKMICPSVSFDSALVHSTGASSESDIPTSLQESTLSKRYSIMSTTSAEFFSAGSSEGSDSKLPSLSTSPDITSQLQQRMDTLRAPSAASVDDECFSTPPSTPTFPGSARSTLNRDTRDGSPLLPAEDQDHRSPTPEPAATTNRKRSLTADSLPPLCLNPGVCVSHSKDDSYISQHKTPKSPLLSALSEPAGQTITAQEEEAEKETNLAEEEADLAEEETRLESSGSVGPDLVCCEPIIIPDTVTPDEFLCSSVLARDLSGILCALAHGGKINNVTSHDNKVPILLSIESGDSVLTEYLFQNGAKLNCTDSEGKGCLHYAVLTDQAGLVVTLIKRGVKPEMKDSLGKDAITYALEKENGDIVTMLRMATFREQADQRSDNRQSEYLEGLQSEFYRDFEVATIVDPERTRRLTNSDSSSVASRDS